MTRFAITTHQVRAIKAKQALLKMDDETYRDLLETRFGVKSCKELTRAEANQLLTHLYGGAKKRRRRPSRKRQAAGRPAPAGANVVAMVTQKQLQLIDGLAREIEWRAGGGLDAWMKASYGITRIRTSAEASKVINGLKGLKQHGHRRQA